jgi:hypothetical protein
MLTSQEFHPFQLQAAIFTPGIKFQSGRALGVLLSGWSDVFTKILFSADMPPGTPDEMPRTIVQSEDSKLKAQIAPSRLDLLWNAKSETDKIDIDIQLNMFTDIFIKYKRSMDCRVGKLACVLSQFSMNPDPGKAIAQHFCNEKMLSPAGPYAKDKSAVIELDSSFHYQLHDWSAVQVIKFKHARLLWGGPMTVRTSEGHLVVVVDQDLSTPPETLSQNTYSDESIKKFFSSVPGEFKSKFAEFFDGESK